MSAPPYRLTGPAGTRGTLGLIVLQVDETIEQDFRRMFPARDVALHVSRIPSGAELTRDTIARMEADLPRAAALLPPGAAFDVVGYGCTSGTTLIGADRVDEAVRGATRTDAVTDPLTAAHAALAALGVRALALVSPYIPSVAEPVCTAFRASGMRITATASFGEEREAHVARVDPASTRAAALSVGRQPGTEAVFLSCTNLRTLDIIDDLERELGCPVLSSNQVLGWHMARLSGAPAEAPGRLFGTQP